jgi:hypothetical protein
MKDSTLIELMEGNLIENDPPSELNYTLSIFNSAQGESAGMYDGTG